MQSLIGGNGKLNRYVLVLNQNYEPLHITHAKRAVILILLGKAELIERYDDEIRC
jgi:hypothetical protein